MISKSTIFVDLWKAEAEAETDDKDKIAGWVSILYQMLKFWICADLEGKIGADFVTKLSLNTFQNPKYEIHW